MSIIVTQHCLQLYLITCKLNCIFYDSFGLTEITNYHRFEIKIFYCKVLGPGISVGIVTDYGLDGPGIESRWGRDFPPVQTGPGANPASCKMGTEPFMGVNCRRGVLLTTHPFLVPRSCKSRAILLPTLWPHRACNGITLLYFVKFFLVHDMKRQWGSRGIAPLILNLGTRCK